MPVYPVLTGDPREFSTPDLATGVPLRELLARVTPPEKLFLVDYASRPGRTRLTLLT